MLNVTCPLTPGFSEIKPEVFKLLNNSLVWDIFLGSRNTTIQLRRCFAGCLLILQLCTISYVFQLAIIDIFCLKLYLNHVLIKHAWNVFLIMILFLIYIIIHVRLIVYLIMTFVHMVKHTNIPVFYDEPE